jgi:hypothetical protein
MTAITSWLLLHPIARKALFSAIGGTAGYAYYYYIGCASGTCPISSNPYISVAYGALMGLVISMNGKKDKAEIHAND